MSQNNGNDWESLAVQAAKETDPEKLIQTVEQLCGVLQQRQERANGKLT